MKSNDVVNVWEETVTIPTYGLGKPEKNPIFLEKRVYQGSSGVVYPHPVIEKILDEKKDQDYHALFLENKYLKIMILPELGGRIQMAYDKIKERHFIYYNQVIKPALVGLTGPWISGGIEFNWPQHHRPSTFEPVDFTIEEHRDGSKTVWVSEVEKMFRTKGMAGFRLYPEKAYLEINAKLFNRTPFPQTFLWWANPAVKVNDHYQSVFPPDVHAVFDHGKRDVSEFPIAKGTYYKVDYSAGVDISRYKNIPVPTSYMAVKSKYDFMGGYEHDSKGGLLHVANHHLSPGKKQWTWGNGEFGYAWDRNLTDEDGPYIELMTGVFTDNQPDFSWIYPFEERTFTQYFMPYSELGVVKNANKEAMVNLEKEADSISIKFYTTSEYQLVKGLLFHENELVWTDEFNISPATVYSKSIPFGENLSFEKLRIRLETKEGLLLVQYQPEKATSKPVPEPAKPAKDPKDIDSIEQLFLTGLHIEQYRHATYNATDYYLEALRREPGDSRNNNAMGLWFLKKGQFVKSESYFRKAIETLVERNPNPINGEAYFNLGVCLFMQEKFNEAYENFYKSTWNAPLQDGAYLYLARIETRKGNFEEALQSIEKSLSRNNNNHSARHLKATILRKLKKYYDAGIWLRSSLVLDKFNFGCSYEQVLLQTELNMEQDAAKKLDAFNTMMRNNLNSYFEYAFDYANAGLFKEAIDLLSICNSKNSPKSAMLYYYIGYFSSKEKDKEQIDNFYTVASLMKPDYCFPNRIEDVTILQHAMNFNPKDSKAPYYLGNFWYANRQYEEAIACWEKSIVIEATFPTVHRNLALAYHNKQNDPLNALKSLETAFALDTSDARVLMELDQLYKKMMKAPIDRLKILEKYLDLTEERDDLFLERISIYNLIGEHQKAKTLIASRKFHPWEGGEGKVVGQYLIAHLELAKDALLNEDFNNAIELLDQAEIYPHNLGEGKLYGARENDIHYLKGVAYEGLRQNKLAGDFYKKATIGSTEPFQAIYYNDQQPDKIFYQGLAWKRLGDNDRAEEIFQRLIEFGKEHLGDKIRIDYFAVSLPDLLVFDQDLDLKNMIHCHYIIALGYLGLNIGDVEKAETHFNYVLNHDLNHIGARIHKKMINKNILVEG
jgi:tetratricopeptide (TPR) repeat protein